MKCDDNRHGFLRAACLSIEQASFVIRRSMAISEYSAETIKAKCCFNPDFRSPYGRGN